MNVTLLSFEPTLWARFDKGKSQCEFHEALKYSSYFLTYWRFRLRGKKYNFLSSYRVWNSNTLFASTYIQNINGNLRQEEILVVDILGFVDLAYAFAFTICKENVAWEHLQCKLWNITSNFFISIFMPWYV